MPGGTAPWWQYKRSLALLPPYSTARDVFRGYRMPRPPPAEEGDTPPGRICWGAVGDLPSPEPLPGVSLVVKPNEEWKEWGRKSEPVRIENPDDPEQYIMDNRPKTIDFNKKEGAKSAPNTAAEVPPGMGGYENTDSFTDSLGEKRTKVRMHYVTQQAPTTTPVPS